MNHFIEKFKDQPRWVAWRLETRNGNQTKVPYTVSGKLAASDNPATWSTYDEVKGVAENTGIILLPNKTLVCIDIDHVIEGGQIVHADKELIANLLLEVDTYIEISQSGTGLHIFIEVEEGFLPVRNRHEPYEIYTCGRYIAVTGNCYGESREVRAVRLEEMLHLLSIIGYPWEEKSPAFTSRSPATPSLTDEKLLQKMFSSKNGDKIKSLYAGNIAAYGNDDSAADMALVTHLSFWTGKDRGQMERLWVNSSLGSRVKTQDRKDYRDRTIKKAIESCTESYSDVEHDKENQTKENGSLVTVLASDIVPKKIQWLWDGKIAKGKLTLLVGDPGLGKSQITAYLSACSSTGNPWPLHSEGRKPAKVLILSGEDDFEDTIVPRLIAYEANLANISLIQFAEEIDNKGGKAQRSFNLTLDVPRLEREFSRLKDVALLVVDPITAYMGNTDSHKNADVRSVLTHLSIIASKYKVAVLAVTHFNKSGNTNAQMKVMGSLAFVAAARAAFLVMKDEADEGKRLFLPMKNNLAKDTGGLSYTLEPKIIYAHDEEISTSIVVWGNTEVKMTANEAMRGGPKKKTPQIIEAEEFLNDALTNKKEGIDAITIKKMASDVGVSPKNLYEAAKNIDAVQTPNGFGKPRIWQLLQYVYKPDDQAGK